MNKAFNLRESGTTKLLHIFKTKVTKKGECHDEALVSVCQEVNINDAKIGSISCLSEENLKTILEKEKDKICKKCISIINSSI